MRTAVEGGVEWDRWRSFIHPLAHETAAMSPVSGGCVEEALLLATGMQNIVTPGGGSSHWKL